ncbi:DUF2878 domain-containing protein (plasmid) [Pseudoalteromonas xiamenensis]|uniref:DUF2878 family protein n=1 Tax=Pseudoalteromonas xiamenensis TaxID=882626 RepID=UPI0027E48C8D|nr:DUF2878 family protein [Pseudoalteromonas xiamenensis]WMN62139.1 DUF2878 domain-containing protein [Pseudoalteromonas xiamenensis]
MRLAINGILFQIAWWATALLRDNAVQYLVVIAILLYLSNRDKRQAIVDLLILLPSLLLVEQTLSFLGLFRYIDAMLPDYIVLLWGCFIFTVRESLSFVFKLNTCYQLLLLSLGCSISYLAAENLNLLTLQRERIEFVLLFGMSWSVCFMLLARTSLKMSLRD